jgi:hypothetical protein
MVSLQVKSIEVSTAVSLSVEDQRITVRGNGEAQIGVIE